MDGQQSAVSIGHGPEPLSNFHPQFLGSWFVDLLCRGDCQERMPEARSGAIPDYRWAKCLSTRADFRGWRMSCEFVACLYNDRLRRKQLRAVQMVVIVLPVL